MEENLVTYITENQNTFVAPPNLSEQEFDLYALQTDIKAMQEKLEKLTKETMEMDKTEDTENDFIVKNLPEFSMITTQGLKTYKDFRLQKHNLIEDSYIYSNGTEILNLPKDTYNEILASKRLKFDYPKDTPVYEKLIDSQYDSYFKVKDNTAENFIHNLSCYCRKEANSPLDAITIGRDLISRMERSEKEKTRLLLREMEREDMQVNHILIHTYFDAVKGIPLDKDTVLKNTTGVLFAKPFNDVISENGKPVDKNSSLKIGDTLKNMAFNIPKTFGVGKDTLYEDLTLISSSEDSNKIICMDKNKSFYELPRDTVLSQYNKQEKQLNREKIQEKHKNRIEIGWER